MKRFILLMAALAALTVALSSANARTDGTDQARSICHRTGSATRPYVKLRVSARAAPCPYEPPCGHHPGAGRRVSEDAPRHQGGTAFNITLVGNVESPAGDPVATGTATVRLRAGQGQVCYKIAASNLSGPAVASHIHKAAAGAAGPVVIPLATPGADGKSGGCVGVARPLVAQILASPASFYVNVHTAEFPAGRDPRPAHRHDRGDGRHRHLARPEGNERAERDRLGGASVPQGRRAGLLTGSTRRT